MGDGAALARRAPRRLTFSAPATIAARTGNDYGASWTRNVCGWLPSSMGKTSSFMGEAPQFGIGPAVAEAVKVPATQMLPSTLLHATAAAFSSTLPWVVRA